MTNMIPAEAARQLAVRYHAFHVAIAQSDANSTIVWGEMLLESIDETGIQIGDTRNIRALIGCARFSESQKAKAA